MKIALPLTLAVLSFGVARGARELASARERETAVPQPYAPSPSAAPFLSVGYREALSDLMFVRLRGYFGGQDTTPDAVTSLCESIVALDPQFHRTYGYCGGAISFYTLTGKKVDQQILLRAIALLERGVDEFPEDWRIPNLAGQIYTQDLKTDDPAQRREWDEKGIRLVESAIRKPGAPAELQDWAAVMRTKYGEQQRAIRDLRELLLITSDSKARKLLIDRLAKLADENSDEIAAEIFAARKALSDRWRRDRPTLPVTWYILLGARVQPGFSPTDLATGGRDLITDIDDAPFDRPAE